MSKSSTDVVLVDFSSLNRSLGDLHNVHHGFRYLASFLRKHGVGVVIQYNLDGSKSRRTLFEEYLERVLELRPRLVGFSPLDCDFMLLDAFARTLKSLDKRILTVFGGHFATFNAKEIVANHPHIDLVARGEGEQTLLDVALAVRAGETTRGIPGLAYRREGRLELTPPRPAWPDLDVLPFPALDALDEAYASGHSVERVYVASSRGCYGTCTFCGTPSFFGRGSKLWRGRSPGNVVGELRHLHERYGTRDFVFCDDNFLGTGRVGKERALAIADAILESRLEITFDICARTNDVNPAILCHLKRAGLRGVMFGVESGSSRALEFFSKKTSVAGNTSAVAATAREKLNTGAGFIFFDPFMTAEDILANLAYRRALLRVPGVALEHPFPTSMQPVSGSAAVETLRREGLLRGDYYHGYSFAFRDRRVGTIVRVVDRTRRAYYRAAGNKARQKAILNQVLLFLEFAARMLLRNRDLTAAEFQARLRRSPRLLRLEASCRAGCDRAVARRSSGRRRPPAANVA